MKMVIVDDDTALLRSVATFLSDKGHQVHAFDNPMTACAFIEEETPPDVLILDYIMPKMTGEEMLRRIRETLPESCTVILMSAHTDLIKEIDLNRIGISVFLPKPFDLDRLVELVT